MANPKTEAGETHPSFVANTAATDKFMAPDSTASRPDPASFTDRPRKPNQNPSSTVEGDLKGEGK